MWLYENQNLRIEGHIIGFDEYMNVMLDQAEEFQMKKGTRKAIGKYFVMLIENVGKFVLKLTGNRQIFSHVNDAWEVYPHVMNQ